MPVKRSGKILGFTLAMVLLLGDSYVLAGSKPANIWASVQFNKRSVVAGEPLMVTITVYTSTWFSSPPEFSEIQVPEAIMVDFRQRTGSLRKTIGNKTYPAIEKKFVVYPFRVGENSLPSLTIVTESPPEGDYKGKRRVIKSPERSFTVKPPPDGVEMDRWLTAYGVQLFEQWDKSLDQLKQGDVRERRITIQAHGALAALIPPLKTPEVDFGNVYSKPAAQSNVQNQTSFTGTRTEHWTYLMESRGTYTLPGIVVSWYDPATGKLEHSTIESQEITIAENPNLEYLLTMQDSLQAMLETWEEAVNEPFQWMGLNWWQIAIAGLTVLVVLYLLFRLIMRMVNSSKVRRIRAFESEGKYFENLLKVSSEGDPSMIMGALIGWYDRFRMERYQPDFEHFICESGDPRLEESYTHLKRVVYSSEKQGEWSGKNLVKLVGEKRKKVIRERSPIPSIESDLLNPGSEVSGTCAGKA